MADGGAPEQTSALTGFEKYSTETLKKILRGLGPGIDEVLAHEAAGTADDRPKLGAATPHEAGATIAMVADGIQKTLKRRGHAGAEARQQLSYHLDDGIVSPRAID